MDKETPQSLTGAHCRAIRRFLAILCENGWAYGETAALCNKW